MKYLLLVFLLSGCGNVEVLQKEMAIQALENRIVNLEDQLRESRDKECAEDEDEEEFEEVYGLSFEDEIRE